MRGAFLIIAACVALAVAGCGGGDDSSSSAASTASTASTAESATTIKWSPPGKFGTKPKAITFAGKPPEKLESKDLIEGTGPEAKAGDQVTVQYLGIDFKKGEEFDSSWSRSEPFTFPLGAGEVIGGWDLGVPGMKVGGRRELVIPPELAYGPPGYPPTIAPNETLIFVIDLLAVK